MKRVALALAMVLAMPAMAQDAERVGDWRVEAFRAADGRFSHCTMTLRQVSGGALIVALTREGGLTLGFANPRWNWPTGRQVGAHLQLDGGRRESLLVDTRRSNLVALRGDAAGLTERLLRSAQVQFEAGRESVAFTLDGVPAALQRLNDCMTEAGAAVPAVLAGLVRGPANEASAPTKSAH